MAAKDQRFDIECPDCGTPRNIGYVAMTLIRSGKRSGRCKSCAFALRGRNGLQVSSPEAAAMRRTRLHNIWQHMWDRCTNPRADNWPYYGGRGITVCARWKVFDNFLADMALSYEDGMTIEREDRDGPYSPRNCRWATQPEQVNNTSRNRFVTYQGRTQTVAQWAAELETDYFRLHQRLFKLGWTPEKAFGATAMSPAEAAKSAAEARWHRA